MSRSYIIAKLIRKKIEGKLQDEERLILDQWIDEEKHHSDLFYEIIEKNLETEDILIFLDLQRDHDLFVDRVSRKTRAKIEMQTSRASKRRTFSLRQFVTLAASVLLILGLTVIYFKFTNDTVAPTALSNLQPGSYRASVTLSNGKVLPLSQDQQIVKLGNVLSYQDGTPVTTTDQLGEDFVDLQTPKGGFYRMELPDGTKLWINADSKVRVPVKFPEHERIVYLEGEAYLEVVKLQHDGQRVPFIVRTPTQEVEVLGTHFNISSYREDKAVTTTLLEGSVRVHAADRVVLLQPGEQSTLIASNLDKRMVNTSASMSWINNEFVFNETEIEQAMSTLGRWYDFQVEFQGGKPEVYFYGTISRQLTLKEVLAILKSSEINFKLIRQNNQNKLIVIN